MEKTGHEPIIMQSNTKILNDSFCYTTSPIAMYSSQRSFCGSLEGGSPNAGDTGGGKLLHSPKFSTTAL